MTRDINYYKDLEKLNYSLYKNLNYFRFVNKRTWYGLNDFRSTHLH